MFYLVNYFPDSHALCSAYDGALALSLARPLNRCLSAPTHRHRSASPHFYTRAPHARPPKLPASSHAAR